MKHWDSRIMFGAAVAAAALALSLGCASGDDRGPGDDAQSVVSGVPPAPAARVSPLPTPRRVERFYGEGDCAPQFPNGMRGTCINGAPCNGYGVRGEKGELECECFGVRGGRPEGTVCSAIYRACVPPADAQR